MRKIKKLKIILPLALCFVLSACGGIKGKGTDAKNSSQKEDAQTESVKYSNLVDEETRKRVAKALKQAGLKAEKITAFFSAVDEYNNAVGKDHLVQKMTTVKGTVSDADNDKLIDLWLKNGGFVGRNCRITSFSLMGDFIDIKDTPPGDTTMLFSDIDVKNTHDTKQLAKEITASWDKRGVSFQNDKMHMISVFMTMDDGKNKVQEFIGHTGILLSEGKNYLFIEKLAFELPYQVEEFHNLQEVNDYLMRCYDKDADGLTAKPIIFEDNHVMNEYRVVKQ